MKVLTNRQENSVEPVRLSPSLLINKSELALIYGAARNRQVAKGDLVFSEKTHSCLILSGSAVLVMDTIRKPEGEIVSAGNWLCNGQMPWSFVANENSMVLDLSPAAFRTLPEKIQLAILQSVTDSTNRGIGNLHQYASRVARDEERYGCYVQRFREKQARLLDSPVVSRCLSEIPQLPQYATELAVKLLLDEANAQEVVEGIRQDPSLASLVLKTINSPYYGLATRISDYYRACLLLGFNNVYRLVIETALHTIMPDTAHFRAIQQRSFLVSLISQELAARCRKTDTPTAATTGLLHGIGNSAVSWIRIKRPETADWIDLIDDAQIGGRLLKKWGLPEQLVSVIANQSVVEYGSPEQFPAEVRSELCVLGAAKIFAALLLNPDQKQDADNAELLLRTLDINDGSYLDTYERHVLPALAQQKKYLPENIRILLDDPA